MEAKSISGHHLWRRDITGSDFSDPIFWRTISDLSVAFLFYWVGRLDPSTIVCPVSVISLILRQTCDAVVSRRYLVRHFHFHFLCSVVRGWIGDIRLEVKGFKPSCSLGCTRSICYYGYKTEASFIAYCAASIGPTWDSLRLRIESAHAINNGKVLSSLNIPSWMGGLMVMILVSLN